MFERFTERARRVLFFARYEASQLGSATIDTEHLLLGLIREGKGLTDRLFADAGIALDDIRDEVLRRVPGGRRYPRQWRSRSALPPSTCCSTLWRKRTGCHTIDIGTEHLLLGLLREQGSVAADMLTSRGLQLDRVREQIVEFLSKGEQPGAPWAAGHSRRHVHVAPAALRAVTDVSTSCYSELKPPQQPVTNHSGPGLAGLLPTRSTEAIVQAWRGNRWHIDIADGLDDGTRYDFYIQLAQTEP